MRKFVGGILRHPMTAESNSNPRAAEPAALARAPGPFSALICEDSGGSFGTPQVPRPVVEVKVRKKEQRKSRKSPGPSFEPQLSQQRGTELSLSRSGWAEATSLSLSRLWPCACGLGALGFRHSCRDDQTM